MSISMPTLITFAIYLLGMFLIGIMAYRLTSSLSDYVLGGRRLGSAVAGLSAGASDMSGWLLLGLPGALYAFGMNQIWIALGLSIGAYLNWLFVAKRLRLYTEVAQDAITIPDFFEKRFRDNLKILRIISALVILIFFTFYASSGLVSGAILFEKSFGMDYHVALWVGAIVVISYTFVGGFLAVSWTDFFQGLLMFLALILVPIVALYEIGGWNKAIDQISSIDPGYLNLFTDMTLLGIISLMAWGLGYFGQPHILVRFMAVKSIKDIPNARRIGMGWMVISLLGAIFTGFLGIAYFAGAPLDNPETVFIMFSQVMLNPWVAGFIIAAILAAIMSTIDSQLLVSSSALAEDFYKALFRKNASANELIWVGRIAVLLIALIAVFLAYNRDSRVLELVSYAWAGFGAAFGPVVILSLFWKRMTRNGALAGIIVGATTVIIWEKFLKANLLNIYEIIPGFILGWAAIMIVSLLDKEPSAEILEEFEAVKNSAAK